MRELTSQEVDITTTNCNIFSTEINDQSANGNIPSWASKLKKWSTTNCSGTKSSMSVNPSAPSNEDRRSQSHVRVLYSPLNKSWEFEGISNVFGKPKAANSTLYGSLLRNITSERLRRRHASFAWTSQEFQKLQTLLQRHTGLPQGKSNIINGENLAPLEEMDLVKTPDSYLHLSLTWEGISYIDYRRVGFLMPSKTRSFFGHQLS